MAAAEGFPSRVTELQAHAPRPQFLFSFFSPIEAQLVLRGKTGNGNFRSSLPCPGHDESSCACAKSEPRLNPRSGEIICLGPKTGDVSSCVKLFFLIFFCIVLFLLIILIDRILVIFMMKL